jgi:aspartyl-tRNA(Asn)/glutamyl-tRNA(Gln) amidotransferase subunit A
MNIVAMGAERIAATVRNRELDPAEVAAAFGREIAERNPVLNAVVGESFFAGAEPGEGLADDIATLRHRIVAGDRLPLAGVPVVVKDVMWVRGRRVTQGSQLFRDFIAPEDAQPVARLREAGALIIGMANSSEFACKGVTTNKIYGMTRHPADPSLTPGGSSGGCAVAVSAHMAALALGTDAGGSSRRPPAHVGIVGFKPSQGAIADAIGFPHAFHGLTTPAPMAASVADAALMFDALAGFDRLDPRSIALEPSPDVNPQSIRVAFSPRMGLNVPVDEDVAQRVEAAAERLARAGFQVVREDPAWPAGASDDVLFPLQHAALAALYGDAWQRDPRLFDDDIGRQIERGLACTGAEVARGREASWQIALAMADFLSRFDVLLCPTAPCVAWPHHRLGPAEIGGEPVGPRGHAVFTSFANHAGVPAVSLPCGGGRCGLPVGVQLIVARGRDRFLLDVARVLEELLACETLSFNV